MIHGTGLAALGVTQRLAARRPEVVLVGVVFVVFLLTASLSYICLDVWSANYASWRLSTTGSPYLDGVSVPELDHHPFGWVWFQPHAANGHSVITRAPAVVIAGLPAYWLFHPATMTLLPGAVTAAALTALAVLFMYRSLTTLVTKRHALAAALAFAVTTPVWSVAANGVWPQTITVLGISVLAWGAATGRWWSVGFGGVLLLWARPHAALIVAVLGLVLAWRARKPAIALRAGAPGAVSLVLLSLWTYWVYGSWNPTTLYGAGAFGEASSRIFDVVNQLAMWVSPDRGILVFTPVLLVLLPTLVRCWRDLPAWVTTLLLAGLAYTVLQAALIGFTGGDPIYGYRYGLEFLACATPAFTAAAVRVTGWAARLLLPVLVVQFFVIMLGAVVEQVALPYTQAWVDNAFLNAARDAPLAFLCVYPPVICAGVVLVRVVWRWSAGAQAAPPSETVGQESFQEQPVS
jgi:hypothetical protein